MNEIDAMSRLLELGGTMLAEHCSRCGAPMFRYQGNVGCPICDFKMAQSGKDGKRTGTNENRNGPDGIPLSDLISKKIAEIASDMDKETDLGRVRNQMDCIERGLRILGMLGS